MTQERSPMGDLPQPTDQEILESIKTLPTYQLDLDSLADNPQEKARYETNAVTGIHLIASDIGVFGFGNVKNMFTVVVEEGMPDDFYQVIQDAFLGEVQIRKLGEQDPFQEGSESLDSPTSQSMAPEQIAKLSSRRVFFNPSSERVLRQDLEDMAKRRRERAPSDLELP